MQPTLAAESNQSYALATGHQADERLVVQNNLILKRSYQHLNEAGIAHSQ